MEHLVEERIPVQRRLLSPMPLDGFNAPAGRQGQEAERLYQAEFGHENLKETRGLGVHIPIRADITAAVGASQAGPLTERATGRMLAAGPGPEAPTS